MSNRLISIDTTKAAGSQLPVPVVNEVNALATTVSDAEWVERKGQPGGYVSLTDDRKIDQAFLPSSSVLTAELGQVLPKLGLLTWYEMTMLPSETQWLGQGYVRLGEPNPTDREIKFFADNGMQIMLTVLPQHGPYGGGDDGIAALIADYLDHISTILDAYGPDGTYWAANPTVPYNPIRHVEIMNEPNFYWDNGYYTGTSTSATGASVTGTTATLKFPSAPDPEIVEGEWVSIAGVAPIGYNSPQYGRVQVTGVTSTPGNYSISYELASTANTGVQTGAGVVTYAKQKAKHYAMALAAAYDHIKNNWPDVVVIGFSGGDASAAGHGWFVNVMAALDEMGRLDCFDVASDHPYSWKSFEVPMHDFFGDWSGVSAVTNVRSVLRSYGIDKPLWLTETGYPITAADGGYYPGDTATHFDGSPARFSQEIAAAWTVRTAVTAARLGIERIYHMHVCDTDGFNGGWFGTDAGTLSYQMGLGRDSATAPARKVATAMRLLHKLVGDATQLEILLDGVDDPEADPFAYRFHTPRGRVTVAWCEVEGVHSIPVDPDVSQVVTTQLGLQITGIGGSPSYRATLGPTPIFIFPAPPRVKSVRTLTDVTVLGADPNCDYTTYLDDGGTAVMPNPYGLQTASYLFKNIDDSSHEIATSIKTVALLHGEGTNNSTTIVDSGLIASDWNALGDAKVSTAQSKFGSASIAINVANAENRTNNSGSRVQATADPTAFAFGTGDFTIEFWVRFSHLASSGATILMDTRPGAANGSYGVLYMEATDFANKIIYYNSGSPRLGSIAPVVDTWTHVAVSRGSGETRLFVDGVMTGTPYFSDPPIAYTDAMDYQPCLPVFGSDALGSSQMSGYLDDIRITKGEAKYIENFTPPSTALTAEGTFLTVEADAVLELVSTGTEWIEKP